MTRVPLDMPFRERVERAMRRPDGASPIRRRLPAETVLALDRLRLRLDERAGRPSAVADEGKEP